MPTIIMASVPITETASANGLNTLLRSVGTSTSSAAVAVILGSVTMQLDDTSLPSFTAFQDIFWMAGLSSVAAGAVAWFIPSRRPAPVISERATHLRPDRLAEVVVHGKVLQSNGAPAFPSVVTVMATDGSPVDWSRGDNDGSFSVVLPRSGEYLVLANAFGWAPRAEVMQFDVHSRHTCIMLVDQLTVSGTASLDGRSVPGAMVALTQASGEVVQSVLANSQGYYCMALPASGRYVVTMLDPKTMQAHARKLVLDVRSTVVDLDAPQSDSQRIQLVGETP